MKENHEKAWNCERMNEQIMNAEKVNSEVFRRLPEKKAAVGGKARWTGLSPVHSRVRARGARARHVGYGIA